MYIQFHPAKKEPFLSDAMFVTMNSSLQREFVWTVRETADIAKQWTNKNTDVPSSLLEVMNLSWPFHIP